MVAILCLPQPHSWGGMGGSRVNHKEALARSWLVSLQCSAPFSGVGEGLLTGLVQFCSRCS